MKTGSVQREIDASYEKLRSFGVKTIETQQGVMTYVDEGAGEAILISHGIFGGYDQGFNNLHDIFGDKYRKIAVSRFGYPGSNLPSDPSPGNQAEVFLELMDKLNIEKIFLVAASAGGAAGIRFAIDYPEKVKGLILLSSAVPSIPMTKKEIGMTGPPKFILNDRVMLFLIKNFKGIFYSMFGSRNVGDAVFDNLLPVKPRREGIIADSEITNVDMGIHFHKYNVEEIKAPVLVVHAKDDPMVKYATVELFLRRVRAEMLLFPDGGHLIVGHDISSGIMEFVEKHRREQGPPR